MIRGTRPTNRHVIRTAPHVQPKETRLARGTRDSMLAPEPWSAMVEHQLGVMWMVEMRVETLTRNLQVAGAMEMARRLGEAFPRQ